VHQQQCKSNNNWWVVVEQAEQISCVFTGEPSSLPAVGLVAHRVVSLFSLQRRHSHHLGPLPKHGFARTALWETGLLFRIRGNVGASPLGQGRKKVKEENKEVRFHSETDRIHLNTSNRTLLNDASELHHRLSSHLNVASQD